MNSVRRESLRYTFSAKLKFYGLIEEPLLNSIALVKDGTSDRVETYPFDLGM